eukprot:gnl/TRDRNA2_/TRDRNA2_194896_c0_seq1.p1 gnl/TRDRNA2_/TRDRNA2_194896_c0~~gnl/TRDRNA2_/TRDRNA2_194896_c0_seq1.p1  ORF type:complete len:215 (-),score=48.34 gnl/TRDRNA2_/TRDRNA2_194896_c0_seq1:108-752(-)
MFDVCANKCCAEDKPSSGVSGMTGVVDSQVVLSNGGDQLMMGAKDVAAQEVNDAASVASISSRSMSPEEKAREKARLQDLVKQFVRTSMGGVDCTLVDSASQSTCAGKYRIDATLAYMRFERSNGTVIALLAIGSIAEVCVWSELSAGDKAYAVKVMSQDELRNALLIRGTGVGGPEGVDSEIFMSAPSGAERDRIATCMKILRLYGQTNETAA